MKTEKELWAVVDNRTREICWTLGGSSTPAKLMVYPNEKKAQMGLRGIEKRFGLSDFSNLEVRKIYEAKK